jgi:PAS domain S-box-containing protein
MTDARSELADNAFRFRSTLEHLFEGAQIIGRDWRYLYLNPAAARQGGRTAEELVGRTMAEAYPGIEETAMFGVLRKAMESGEPAQFDNEFFLPDGTSKHFQLVVQPVREGLFILSLDVSERKYAEDALRKSRARFDLVLENLHEGLVVVDLDGNVYHWNRAALEMLGFASADEARRSVADLPTMFELLTLDGVQVPATDWPLARARRGDAFNNLELRVRSIDKDWERVFAYGGAIVGYDGESVAFVTIRDITERKELERQFIRTQRMESIGMLAGGIAHDLNNVLMPILLGSSMLSRLSLDERAARTIVNMERSAKRGADLVRQLLTFARGTASPWTAVDLRAVVADIQPIVRSTFPKNITMTVALEEELHAVTGDATQLLQIVLNLCVNARDSMPGGGRITIAARNAAVTENLARAKHVAPGRYVALEVADEGSGMAPEVLARIFDPFFTTKEIGKGTGLGLFTVRDIVRSHGGFTDIFSDVGRGTAFRVFLPAHEGPASDALPEPTPDDLPRGNGERILVVDDEISIISVAKETLEAFGYEVLTAEDGAQAIAHYARHRSEIALVVTDMMMPIVDGAALTAALVRMNPDVLVIATSGTSSGDWQIRAERAGAKHLLTKPYTAALLLRTVGEILAGSRRG